MSRLWEAAPASSIVVFALSFGATDFSRRCVTNPTYLTKNTMDLLSHLKKAKVKNPEEVVAKLAEEEYGTIEELLELKEADLTLLLKNCGVKTKSSIAVRDYLEDLRT